jgi:hypothetical protein
MKKGGVDQTFVYIFVVIVIALIFLFGFNMIRRLDSLNEKTIYATFKSDFTEAVDNVYYKNEGSVLVFDETSNNKPLVLPKSIKGVCFETGRVKLGAVEYDDFNVDKLRVDEEFCIITQDHKISFKLENALANGEAYVRISEI